MSEHDRDVLALLDRAAADVPPLHLEREDVVARGEQIVRRRRTVMAGMGFGGLALAGAAVVALGGSGVLGVTQVQPAGTTWEAPNGVELSVPGGESWPEVVLTKDGADGYGSVRIGTGESAETVAGELVAGGLVVYPGREMTVAVWKVPEESDGRVVQARLTPGAWPEDGEPVEVSGGRLDFAFAGPESEITEAVVEVPRWSGSTVVAATGAQVVTGRVEHQGYGTEIFVLPESGVWGQVEEVMPPSWGNVLYAALQRPLWRGGGGVAGEVGMLGDDATEVRATITGEGEQELLAMSPGVVEEIGGRRFGVVVTDTEMPGTRGLGEGVERNLGLEWADPERVWHRQESPDGQGSAPLVWVPREVVDGEVAGPGEEVVLLGTTYTVAVDPHGWPQLLDSADGSLFLRVADEQGPSAGGMVDMTRWRWPWEGNDWIYFSVGDEPVQLPDRQSDASVESVTVQGPAGQVKLVGVRE